MVMLKVLGALAVVVAAIATAEQQAAIHLRVTRDKFYVTPMGGRCAYNNCVDPSVYPCADGTCVRLNYSHGYCEAESSLASSDSDDRPENEKFPCPYPNPYAELADYSDEGDSDDVGASDSSDYSDSSDDADEDEDDEDA